MTQIEGVKALITQLFSRKSLEKARRDPFQFVDTLSVKVGGHELNLLRLDDRLRKVMFRFSVLVTIVWFLAGWDSTAGQLQALAQEFGMQLLRLNFDWGKLWAAYMSDYGKNTHWSAFVIYGFMYWGLSKYYAEKLQLYGSRNFTLSFSFTFLSIGVFEFAWQHCYAFGQNQFWVTTWAMPQLRILVQCLLFTVIGLYTLTMVLLEHSKEWHNNPPHYFDVYNLNLGKWTILLGVATLGIFLLWYYYPYPITYILVPRDFAEPWVNTHFFPQTLYTVQSSLVLNAGEQWYVPNDFLHGVNNLAKILLTLFFYSLARLKTTKLST